MKILIGLLIILPTISFGKSLKEFNSIITKEVDREIRKDEDKFKVPSRRAPASVSPVKEEVLEEPKKIDKTVRQIGPNSW